MPLFMLQGGLGCLSLGRLLGAAVLTRTLTRIGKTRPNGMETIFPLYIFFCSNVYARNGFRRCGTSLCKSRKFSRVEAFCNGGLFYLSKENYNYARRKAALVVSLIFYFCHFAVIRYIIKNKYYPIPTTPFVEYVKDISA